MKRIRHSNSTLTKQPYLPQQQQLDTSAHMYMYVHTFGSAMPNDLLQSGTEILTRDGGFILIRREPSSTCHDSQKRLLSQWIVQYRGQCYQLRVVLRGDKDDDAYNQGRHDGAHRPNPSKPISERYID